MLVEKAQLRKMCSLEHRVSSFRSQMVVASLRLFKIERIP